jgi:hypothetical protein
MNKLPTNGLQELLIGAGRNAPAREKAFLATASKVCLALSGRVVRVRGMP